MYKPSLAFCIILLGVVFGYYGVDAEDKGKIGIYELRRGQVRIKLTNYGATITSLMVPDRHGLYFILYFLLFIYIILN